MSNICLKYVVAFFVFVFVFILITSPVYATRTISSATLNGSSSVTVVPSASITAVVNVTTIADGSGATWGSTKWTVNGASTCVDHPNHTTAGSYSETFTITSPASVGTYNVLFNVYVTNACGTGGESYTLTNGITVSSSPTPTPTSPPSSSPTPTSSPGTPTPTSSSTSTPTPTTTSSESTSSVTYYPSVTLNTYLPNPTNKASLTFSGTSSIEHGSVSLIEYSITNGASWTAAQGSTSYTFTTPKLAEGTYTVQTRAKSGDGVYTKSESYASQTITIVTTPPQVTLDKITPNPTKNQTPILTGHAAAKLVDVARVDVSIDNGKSWQVARKFGNSFSYALAKLEDGNYPVKARALDSAGNIGESDTQTLIIDTIPPIIRGGMQSLGPQILAPDKNGIISIVAGTETTIAMSMKGGVTEAIIKTGSSVFPLSQKQGTNIWVGKIKLDPTAGSKQEEEKLLTVSAVDGAGNTTERQFNTLKVENSGIVEDKKTKQAIEGAEVSVYFFETFSRQWILWGAESYGQSNLQRTNGNGSYSFMAPAGKYYIDVNAPGYKSIQSEIITVSKTSILNYKLDLTSKPKIEFNLPIVGHVVLTVPSFSPPETFSVQKTSPKPESKAPVAFKAGTSAPDFSLPNLEEKQVSPASFKGKKLLITFISQWSPPSLEQAPFLSEVSSSVTGNQKVLVVSLQESVATTQTMMKKGNYKFPVVADKDGTSAALYKITLLPHHVFIDSNGKIRETFTGVLTKEELMKKLSNMP